jgi:phage/plasmid-like protein (TIGR03299 family)
MAHEVENMFSVKETPWHKLGRVITDAPSIEEVLKLAGLDWSVSLRPLDLTNPDGTIQRVTQNAIVRDSDNSVLGFTGKRYRPLQNSDALDFFRPFQESGLCNFETAGSLRQGQKIWIMASLNSGEMEIVKGDVVRKYLLLSNGHDGKMGIRVGFTPVRVVCANTLAMAHGSNESKLIRVFHSSKTLSNLETLRETINAANASFEATADQYRRLANRGVNAGDVAKYIDIVFYNGKQAESDREKIARETLNDNITRLFETGHGNDLANVRGTYWALYNGVTQYLSYEQGRTDDSRLDSLWYGANKDLNKTALDMALTLAG